jgi:hypothetical protein
VWLLGVLVALGAVFSRRPTPRLPAGVDAEDLAAGHERSDMQARVVLLGAAGLGLILAVLLVAVTALEALVTGVPPTIGRPADLIQGLQAAPQPTPAPPELEAYPGESLDPYMAAEQQKLSTYRWVDRQSGVVAIPIDRAIDLVAQQGLPARAAAPAAQDEANASPSSASSGRTEEAYP